jgi:hypothetical protein
MAQADQPFVVFMIGMRINNFWAVHKWMPMFQAMNPMINELYRHPEKGFLGGTFAFTFSGPFTVQYWRSFEDLERFAHNPDDPHLPAWKRFYQLAKESCASGVWHETYLISPGQYEAVYVNMPRFGLSSAMKHLPAAGRHESARGRFAKEP